MDQTNLSEPDIMKEMAAAFHATMERHFDRVRENIRRVGSLAGVSIRSGQMDVLRSAVVFLHATVEDFLRSLAVRYLACADEEVLNRVAFVGSDSGRPEKFWLGRLALHRGKTVDELIALSIEQHLGRTTFNNPREVAELLKGMSFDPELVEKHFALLEDMMARRHQIVHRADRTTDGEIEDLDSDQVMQWATNVGDLVSKLLAQACNREAFTKAQEICDAKIKELEAHSPSPGSRQ